MAMADFGRLGLRLGLQGTRYITASHQPEVPEGRRTYFPCEREARLNERMTARTPLKRRGGGNCRCRHPSS